MWSILDSPRRMLWGNLMGGIAKGLGMAVGFAVLGRPFDGASYLACKCEFAHHRPVYRQHCGDG